MQFLARWPRTSTPRAREIVLEVLKSSHPMPVKTQDLYQRVRKDYADEKVPVPPPIPETRLYPPTMRKSKPIEDIVIPPHPDHPIRSVKYLKSVVLRDLAARNEVEKVHGVREPTAEELKRKREGAPKKRKNVVNVPQVVINSSGMVDQWAWALKTTDKVAEEKKERLRIEEAIKGQKKLDTKQVEKDQKNDFMRQWGHLNVRRQRARVGKLEREEKLATFLERGRQEGMTGGTDGSEVDARHAQVRVVDNNI